MRTNRTCVSFKIHVAEILPDWNMLFGKQFKYTYIFGAVCPARDEAVGLILPYANTDTMLIHLEHISAKKTVVFSD